MQIGVSLITLLVAAIGVYYLYRLYRKRLQIEREEKRNFELQGAKLAYSLDRWLWAVAPEVVGDQRFTIAKVVCLGLFSRSFWIELELPLKTPWKLSKVKRIASEFFEKYRREGDFDQYPLTISIRKKTRRRFPWHSK